MKRLAVNGFPWFSFVPDGAFRVLVLPPKVTTKIRVLEEHPGTGTPALFLSDLYSMAKEPVTVFADKYPEGTVLYVETEDGEEDTWLMRGVDDDGNAVFFSGVVVETVNPRWLINEAATVGYQMDSQTGIIESLSRIENNLVKCGS